MPFTYTWTNAEQISLLRTDTETGATMMFPTDPANRHYAEFLASGETAAAYVEPPVPPEPTAEEKLAASGLTVDELKGLLGI